MINTILNKMSSLNIRPVFTIDLNHTILIGKVTIGKYDGTHPCLTAVTNSDKILIHSPHRRSALATGRITWSHANKEVAFLNMSQTITAILAAKVLPNDERDMLIIGSPSHILVYNVHDNRDIFYKECVNGVNAITVGNFGLSTTPNNKNQLIFVGGNCSIHGFDHSGNEIFWTVIGDNVTDMIIYDFNNDGENKLVVGSEDFTIRVFKNTNVISELHETETVNTLSILPDHRFAYGVGNGTIGVYEQDIRLWRVKSKNNAIAIRSFDLLGHGSEQLITGWSNGKIDVRTIQTGEVLYKEHFGKSIAGIVEADYRGVGKTDLICITIEGEVRGYATSPTMIVTSTSHLSENEIISDLFTRKQTLLLELRHYEGNLKFNNDLEGQSNRTGIIQDNVGVIPANTRLQIGISTELKTSKPHVDISISTNNSTIIRAVMIFAEGIFEGETLVVHPKNTQLASMIRIPIYPPKDVPVDIHIKAFVGYPDSIQYHVFELTRQLPKFSMYALLTDDEVLEYTRKLNTQSKLFDSYVEFRVNERLPRICIWINQNFLLPIDVEPDMGLDPEKTPDFILTMIALRTKSLLRIQVDISGKFRISTEDMLLATDLIQSLAVFLNLSELQVKASFPKDEELLRSLFDKLIQLQNVKLHLGTDIADKLGQIRELVLRAEDARLNDLKETAKHYNQLKIINEELITGYNIRLSNYNECQDTIKKINLIIQRSSRLRVGKYASNVVNACKIAIKNNNVDALIKIMRLGDA